MLRGACGAVIVEQEEATARKRVCCLSRSVAVEPKRFSLNVAFPFHVVHDSGFNMGLSYDTGLHNHSNTIVVYPVSSFVRNVNKLVSSYLYVS